MHCHLSETMGAFLNYALSAKMACKVSSLFCSFVALFEVSLKAIKPRFPFSDGLRGDRLCGTMGRNELGLPLALALVGL